MIHLFIIEFIIRTIIYNTRGLRKAHDSDRAQSVRRTVVIRSWLLVSHFSAGLRETRRTNLSHRL